MNILFIHHRYHTNLHNWFRGFQKNGHKVDLLVYKPDELGVPDLPKSTFLNPSRLSRKRMYQNRRMRGDGVDSFSPYYFPSFKELYAFFKKKKPDIIVIRPVFTFYGYQLILLALIFRIRIVFHSRIRIHRYYSTSKLFFFKSFMRLLNAFWISPCLGKPEEFPSQSKRLVYFPFTIQPAVKERTYFENGRVNILCIAKYFKSKNPLLMIHAFEELKKEHKSLHLTICGTGDENGDYFQDMLELKRNSRFTEHIELLINQPYTVVEGLYKSHDIFVLPTNHDPASFTVLEAMSFGLVTITTNIDGSAGYIKNGENGFIFEKGNLVELVSKLEELVKNRETIIQQGKNSVRLTKINHDPVEVTSKFLNQVLA